ncbi:amino acid deaminase/aldolase [Corynebacterium sp. H78]|uniref:amino acid deaminase/aldolase n=1 Tax=Corynebacterium sp. H78 TaxID=3133417 RepID=UPI0030A6CC8F
MFSPAVPDAVRSAIAHEQLPALVVDLEAIDANAQSLLDRAHGMPIRVASKSVRIPELLRYVLNKPGFQGILAYTLPEALALFRDDISDDILVAYPSVNTTALTELADDPAARAAICLMVDSPEHIALIARHATDATPIRVCLDIDASWRPAPGVHIGTRRSPAHSSADAVRLAKLVTDTPGLALSGIMMYEGHIAGVGDKGRSARSRLIRVMQRRSRAELAKRREAIVTAVEKHSGPLEFVNGGGTGSFESTCVESAVTEVAAGSGFLAPTLFDGYRAFTLTPAAWFVVPVVRKPHRSIATVAGGGRIASGPAGADRLPTPVYPAGLKYVPDEGPGEVQTPLTGQAAKSLGIGDAVWFRHAKAGEIAEHANETLIVAGGEIIHRWPTYRGKGLLFT